MIPTSNITLTILPKNTHPSQPANNHVHSIHPVQTLNTQPIQSLNTQPIQSLNTQPIQSLNTQPIQSLNTQPIQSLNTQPIQSLNTQPIQSLNAQPIQTLNIQPVQTLNAQPIQSLNTHPVKTLNTQPIQTLNIQHVQSLNIQHVQTLNLVYNRSNVVPIKTLNITSNPVERLNVISNPVQTLNLLNVVPNITSDHSCYILKSLVSNRIYVGYTVNLPRRIRQHNGEIAGGAKKTKKWRPWIPLCHIRGFYDESTALRFEYRLQHPKSRKKAEQDSVIFIISVLDILINSNDGSYAKNNKIPWPILHINWFNGINNIHKITNNRVFNYYTQL